MNMKSLSKPATPKPSGAYRPPGARGLATPSIFKREDEGGAPRMPTNGTSTPPGRYSRSPGPPGAQQNGKRHVPGAAPPSHSPSPGPDADKKTRKRNKGAKKDGKEGGEGADTPKANGNGKGPAEPKIPPPEIVVPVEEPATPVLDGSLDPAAKKIRNLNKKV